MSELARMVRRHRVQQQLTQKQASEQCGLSLATWQSLERETVAPTSFQGLTLAAVANGLKIPLATVYRWAQQPLPDVASRSPRTTPEMSVDEQIDQFAHLLRRLADVSEMSYLLAYGQGLEITDHLIQLHEGRADTVS